MSLNINRIVDNNTPLFVRPFHQRDHEGHDTVTVVAKLTWRLSTKGEARIAIPQRAIRPLPHRNEEGGAFASLLYPEDTAPNKPGTDVIMLAAAHPPEGKNVDKHDVSLRVETGNKTIQKAVRVFGPRAFLQGALKKLAPGPAQPLTMTPLRYELAEGGIDKEHYRTELVMDAKNPSGRGIAKDPVKLVGTPAYQIESLSGAKPAGFGPIDGHWEPRRSFGGTSDAAYAKRRYPIAPKDFDPRFNCASHPDLWSEEPLLGDEAVEVLGATPEGEFRFRLPRYQPLFRVTKFGEELDHTSHLDTFLIDLEDPGFRVVEQCWRLCVRLPKKSEHLQKVRIHNNTPIAKELFDQMIADIDSYKRGEAIHVH